MDMALTGLLADCSDPATALLLTDDRCLSVAEVRTRADDLVHALTTAGLRPGDCVAVATRQGSDIYTSFAACWTGGFTMAVMDADAGTLELDGMLATAAPRALIADAEVLERIARHCPARLPDLIWRPDAATRHSGPSAFSKGDSATVRIDASRPAAHASGAEPASLPLLPDTLPAYMIFTSGTTSRPKAVVVSRAALRHHVTTLSRVFGYGRASRLLHFLPMHHTDGLVHGVAVSLFTGMSVLYPGRFTTATDLEHWLRVHAVSHFLTVPTVLAMIRHQFRDNPRLFRQPGFRHLISTAGYLDADLWADFESFFGVRVSNFYGMTETVSGSLYCGPDDATHRIGTVGRPIDCEVRLVDESGCVLGDGQIGELQISGPHLMTGYRDDPAGTHAVLQNGWLSTGDLFERTSDGYLRIVGRRKALIKRGGVSVFPEDVRSVVARLPGVRDVEVLGLPDAAFGELIGVAAVVEDGITTDAIRAWCRQALAPERQPDRVVLLDVLPRGSAGKIQHERLLAVLTRDTGKRATASAASLRDQVLAIAAQIFDVAAGVLDESSSPDSVPGWDSYANMEFILALENAFALHFTTRDIMSIRNLDQALQVVSSARDRLAGAST